MIVEMFVAGLAAFVWAATTPGILHSVAYNIMFVASVSTVVFNANPLLRFDGYYILSDLLDIPNLHQRSTGQLRHLVEYHAFGCKKSTSPALNRKEAVWLTLFAAGSGIYRVVVFSAILFFIADQFLILGILMAVVCAAAWVCVPACRLVVYLASNPRLERVRGRAVAVTTGCALVLVTVLEVIPFPNHFRAPGVVQAKSFSVVVTQTSGVVTELLAANGASVRAGEPLFRMVNEELALRLAGAQAQQVENDALQRKALRFATADLAPLQGRIEATRKLIARLEEEQAALLVRAPHAGTWVAPGAAETKGSWLDRGTAVGQLVDGSQFYFSAIVSQREAARLFSGEIRSSAIKLKGQAGVTLPVGERTVIPAERKSLPSAALGWAGGGEIAIDNADRTGLQAAEPFFEVRADVSKAPAPASELLHGRGGQIRFEGKPAPLLQQWIRRLRQLLQTRYGL